MISVLIYFSRSLI